MGWDGWGHATSWAGWLAMWLTMLAFWGVVAALVVWLVRSTKEAPAATATGDSVDPRKILDERLARGELTEEEYLRRRELLGSR